jgi:prevent-host-death family protein
MSDIGIRELKTRASEIVRQVKERRASYIVTHRGHPVAAIIPIEEIPLETEETLSAWDELLELGIQIGQNWETEQSSTELLSEMRR